jgi:hydroxymethylpyrimidine/phosphomethylpyrimidine kinase
MMCNEKRTEAERRLNLLEILDKLGCETVVLKGDLKEWENIVDNLICEKCNELQKLRQTI